MDGTSVNRTGQVWLMRSDSRDEFTEYVIVGRVSYDQYSTFGWHVVSLDGRQERFGVFENQLTAAERGKPDEWVRSRVA